MSPSSPRSASHSWSRPCSACWSAVGSTGSWGPSRLFVIIGFFARRRSRDARDHQVGEPVPGNDRVVGQPRPTGGGSERGMTPRSCVWSKRVERAGRDRRDHEAPDVAEAPEASPAQAWPRAVQPLVPAHRRRDRRQHRRPHPRPAVPEGRQPRARPARSRLLHQRARSSSRRRTRSSTGPRPPRRRARSTFTPASATRSSRMWIVDGRRPGRRHPHDPRLRLIPGRLQNIVRVRSTSRSATSALGIAGPPAAPYIPLFAAFFLLILFSNWIGLVPPRRPRRVRSGRRRATSTSPSAWPWCRFVIFEVEGFRKPRLRAATSASSSRSTSSRTASAPASSRCSSASSSSCSSSSSRSRCRCDSSATSTAARSRSA